MKNIALIAIAVIVLGTGYYYLTKPASDDAMMVNDKTTEAIPAPDTAMLADDKTAETSPVDDKMVAEANQTFAVKGLNYAFDVKEIKVKKGEVVQVDFTNTEGMHDFLIDEFNVNTGVIKEGETKSVTFTADKAGEFEFYCSVGQHRANGMWGKLIVEE